MQLAELMKALPFAQLLGDGKTEVMDIVQDSRRVTPGALFVCLKGLKVDGHDFVKEALGRGAAGVVAERRVTTDGKPLLLVPDTREALGLLCHRFHGDPTKGLTLIGVTGTNGKTTTSHLIAHILNAEAGKEVAAVIGTLGVRWGGRWHPLDQTTPDAPTLVRKLAWLRDEGAKFIVMEVSSHALAQKRTEGCLFDAAVFTNLSRDHLDFHGTFENYFSAKARLFTDYAHFALRGGKAFHAFLNADDPYGRNLSSLTPTLKTTFGFSRDADYRARDLRLTPSGTRFVLHAPDAITMPLTIPLIGRFNVLNALGAIAVAKHLGARWETIRKALKEFRPLPGRLEIVDEGQPFMVAVDYAHTPDALRKVLQAIREITGGRIIVVFGCGGDRDPTKRPEMGRIATVFADYAIITSDNPRTEDPSQIIAQIARGVIPRAPHHVEPDRRKAIFHAIASAGQGDFVLIAGKGHETYQIVGTEKIPFDDRKIAREALRERFKGSSQPLSFQP